VAKFVYLVTAEHENRPPFEFEHTQEGKLESGMTISHDGGFYVVERVSPDDRYHGLVRARWRIGGSDAPAGYGE
jgi:hypothetical protein